MSEDFNQNDNDAVELETFTASDIESKPIKWLHEPYIPIGSVVEVIGDGGAGKSYFSCAIAAALTRGLLVTGEPSPLPPSDVIICNDENPWESVIVPRLLELNADMYRVHGISTDKKRLTLTDPRIEAAIIKHSARLLICDPIQNCLPSNLSMNRAESIRPALMNLRKIAERTDSIIMLVGHISKGRGKAQHRGLGSVDIVNSVVSVMYLGKVEGFDEDVRVIAHGKANFGEIGKSMHFRLNKQDGFVWLGECDATPEDIMAFGLPKRKTAADKETAASKARKREQAKAFLLDFLADSRQPSNDIYREGIERDLSKNTIKLAKDELPISAIQFDRQWYWELS